MKQISFKTLLFFLVYACSISATNPQDNCQEPQQDPDLQNVIDAEREEYDPRAVSCTNAHGRNHYKDKKDKKDLNSCIFCTEIADDNDRKNLILGRFDHFSIFLNLYPYGKGHIMIVSNKHVRDLDELSVEARYEFIELEVAISGIMKRLFSTDMNRMANIGRDAGASIPDHYHYHLLPRKRSDQGAVEVIAHGKVIDAGSLPELYEDLRPYFLELERSMKKGLRN